MRIQHLWAGSLACSLTLGAALAGSVQAQMVNDPAQSVIFNTQAETQLPSALPEPSTPAGGSGKMAAPPKELTEMELTPELDIEPAGAAPAAAQELLKARAVMVDINSDTLNYDKDRDVYVATGSVHMVISEQNSELFADKMTYDQNQDLVIAEGNVVIVKDGQKTNGSYAKIDLSRKSALINDYATAVQKVRIKAQTAFVDSKFVQYENGRIILEPGAMQAAFSRLGGGRGSIVRSQPAAKTTVPSGEDENISRLATQHQQQLESTDLSDSGDGDTGVNAVAAPKQASAWGDKFHWKAKEIDVYRDQNGYNQVFTRWPSLYYKNWKIASMPTSEFSFDEPSGSMEYLGPDIGYDPDYGGFYLGPGWDFRVGGHSSVRISPLLSMGGGGRRMRGGAQFEDRGVGPGVGAIVHFRSPDTTLDFGYNSRVGQPVLLGEHKLFDGKTRLKASANEDYINGFMGYERPGYGLQITDGRKIKEWSKFRLDSYASLGWYKDEFFPTYDDTWFVAAKGDKPGQAGRLQWQGEFRNTKPLLSLGGPTHNVNFGFRANVIASAYSTGDFAGLIRGGPTMNVQLGDRFTSSLRYYFAYGGGETPFVFDTYYQGRQNMVWSNAVKINEYLTVGMRSNMSLLRDNARNSLFTGNQLFMLVGPRDVKFNVAYDVIRKRSFFGINFYPGTEEKAVDFEQMRVFQPETYNYLPNP